MIENGMLSFLSRDWAGSVIAGVIGLGGLVCWWVGRQDGGVWCTGVGYVLIGLSVMLQFGALRHIHLMRRTLKQFPIPGRLVQAGGQRLHVLVEGQSRGKSPVLWMPGAHAPGFNIHHLHRVFREHTCSILIDRAGAGWSDPACFPRTTMGEAGEIIAALESLAVTEGEKGPFVLVGHSYGGLLLASVARQRPDLVKSLVLLDATVPELLMFSALNDRWLVWWWLMRGNFLRGALLHLFGVHSDPMRALVKGDARAQAVIDSYKAILGDALHPALALSMRSAEACATYSIFGEMIIGRAARRAFLSTGVVAGELGDMPLFVVFPIQQENPDNLNNKEALKKSQGLDEAGWDRYLKLMTQLRASYAAMSSNGRIVHPPAGAGHNFPYEVPDFVVQLIHEIVG